MHGFIDDWFNASVDGEPVTIVRFVDWTVNVRALNIRIALGNSNHAETSFVRHLDVPGGLPPIVSKARRRNLPRISTVIYRELPGMGPWLRPPGRFLRRLTTSC
jgi:hypothetical protein